MTVTDQNITPYLVLSSPVAKRNSFTKKWSLSSACQYRLAFTIFCSSPPGTDDLLVVRSTGG